MPPARCCRPPLDLNSAVAAVKINPLKTFIESKRQCFKEYEKQGIEKYGKPEYVQRIQCRCNADYLIKKLFWVDEGP